MIVSFITALAAIVWLVWITRAGLVAARMYQIEEYEAPRFLVWGRQQAWLWSPATLIAGGTAFLLGLFTLALPINLQRTGIGIDWLASVILLHILWRPLPAKKALVYTPRMRRILSTGALLTLLLACIFVILLLISPIAISVIVVILSFLLASGLVLFLIIAANALMGPVEAQIRRGFVRRARSRITTHKPFVVGIAGSYGKTSTKNIMAQLLAPHKETLQTPKSFNTLMGITRAINENLEPKHELFLVEMDAYNIGEIAAMCNLVEPQLAVITSVGPQHLERFGTIERIADALYELVASLPAGSPAVIYSGERV